MEWVITIFSSLLSLLSPLWRRKNLSLVVEERHPGEVKEVVVEYEDKHYPKPIKRTVGIPGKKVHRKYLIKESSPWWIKKFWGKGKLRGIIP